MKVGEHIKDGDGNEWVIAQKWLQPNGYTDLRLIHVATGIEGSLRVKSNKT